MEKTFPIMENTLPIIQDKNLLNAIFQMECYTFVFDTRYYMAPLNQYYSLRDQLCKSIELFFQNMDETFKKFMNIQNDMKEIQRLINKETDGKHKYYVIFQEDTCVALFNVYDYRQKYGKTKIALGLSKEIQGKGLGLCFLKEICEKLECDNHIVRIEAEVETENTPSLKMCKKMVDKLDFVCEGLRKNNWGQGIHCMIFARIKDEDEQN